MKWLSLWKRIGKQPLSVTQHQDVIAVIDEKEIPLTLKFGTGEKTLWFVKDEKEKKQ